MALFIQVEVDPAVAKDAAAVKKLVEVCPVNIFAQKGEALEIVDANLTSARSASCASTPVPQAQCA
jgi:hypothetical protein